MGVTLAIRDSEKKRADNNFKSWEPCYFRWKTDLGLSSVGKRSQIPLCTVSDANRYFRCKTCKGLVYILNCLSVAGLKFSDLLKFTKEQYITRHKHKSGLGCWVFIRWEKYLSGRNTVKSFHFFEEREEADIFQLQVEVNELKGHLRFIFADMYLGQGCVDHKELDLLDTMALTCFGFFFFPVYIYSIRLTLLSGATCINAL